MVFKVHIVSEEDYNAHVKELAANGNAGEVKVPDTIVNTIPSPEAEEDQK